MRAPPPQESATHAATPTPRPAAATDKAAPLGPRTWTAIVLVGLTGQLAWTVENMYLNVFLYNTVTASPTAIAGMVAASAVAATIATLLLGTASDKLGRRREIIAIGYVLWGASTAAFGLIGVDAMAGLVGAASAVAVTTLAIVALDCLMSFLGAGANDAAFTAWITDVTRPSNRGRVDGVLAIMPLLAMLLVFGALDPLTQAGQWGLFFGIIGAVTAAVGLLSLVLVRDVREPRGTNGTTAGTPAPSPRHAGAVEPFFSRLVALMRPSAIRQRPGLYLALAAWCLVGVATQVFLPYLIIYVQRYLHIDAYAVVLGAVLLTASVISVLGGRLIDRIGKVRAFAPALLIFALGLAMMFVVRGFLPVIGAGIVMMSGLMLATTAASAIVRDHTPPERAGALQGVRMIMVVLIPMVIGPFLGAAVIVGANETYSDLGQLKQVPTPWIFLVAAAVALLALLPARLLRRFPASPMPDGAAPGSQPGLASPMPDGAVPGSQPGLASPPDPAGTGPAESGEKAETAERAEGAGRAEP